MRDTKDGNPLFVRFGQPVTLITSVSVLGKGDRPGFEEYRVWRIGELYKRGG